MLTVNPSLPTFFTLMNYHESSRYLSSLDTEWESLKYEFMSWLINSIRSHLHEQEEGVNISANAVHPGVIATNLFSGRIIVAGIFLQV